MCAELVVIPKSQFVRSCLPGLPNLAGDSNGVNGPDDLAPIQVEYSSTVPCHLVN